MFTSTISTISTPIIQGESKWSSLITKRVFGDMHHAEVYIVLNQSLDNFCFYFSTGSPLCQKY